MKNKKHLSIMVNISWFVPSPIQCFFLIVFWGHFFTVKFCQNVTKKKKIQIFTREIKISEILPISLSKNSFTNTDGCPRVFEIPRTDGSLILLCSKYQKKPGQFFRF